MSLCVCVCVCERWGVLVEWMHSLPSPMHLHLLVIQISVAEPCPHQCVWGKHFTNQVIITQWQFQVALREGTSRCLCGKNGFSSAYKISFKFESLEYLQVDFLVAAVWGSLLSSFWERQLSFCSIPNFSTCSSDKDGNDYFCKPTLLCTNFLSLSVFPCIMSSLITINR